MNPEIAKALAEHLDKQNQEKRDSQTRAIEREKAIEQNLADFEVAKSAVIKPAFQEIVDLYQERGVAIRVAEQDDIVNRKGASQLANIRLDMAPAYPPSDLKPVFQLSFNKASRMLSLYTSTGSQAGPGGDVALDSIAPEWIHREFAKYQGIPIRPTVVFGKTAG